ncbi:MAG: bifunctional enoyl-CoA hydratase/phosphate acetyltransferase [Desulfovibrionaceae bacterium]
MSVAGLPVTSLDGIAEAVLRRGGSQRVAIAPCADEFVLRGGCDAAAKGVAVPVLVGDEKRTRHLADALGFDISGYEIVHEPDPVLAVERAVALVREGNASMIMKGLVSTSVVLKAILNKETGLPPKTGILSHVTAFQAPDGERLMLLTDAGVNIKPNLRRKADILRNALGVARALGMVRPRAAMLAATEKVNYPAMPATLDADIISKMAEQGQFGDALVCGPMALDIALSPQAAMLKGMDHPVAGHADVLCAPDIESGNMLYKALGALYGAALASVVVGSRVPIVVPSRSDSAESKYYSIALAAFLAGEGL